MSFLKRLPIFMGVILAAVVFPSVAFAQDGPPLEPEAVSAIVIAAPIVTIIIALLIPLLNGVLTKASTAVGVKVVGTIVLNTVAALITNGMVADGSATFSSTTLYTALLGCIISITTYAGVYKPLAVTSNPGGKLADVGVHD